MARDELYAGTIIGGRYEICEEIGAGGMGTVYRVKDTLLGEKEIALKTLLDEYAREKSYVERFIREIELMNQVNHPNVVRTYDIGTDADLIYFTMEFVKGITLEDILERGPVPLKDIPLLLMQICRGLNAIHKAEIIHRDLKPGNILLLADGTVKITDFGVARPKTSRLTKKNERVGSIWYMAPETWQGGELTRITDLYSVGVLLFEAITGRLPFESDEPAQLMQMHLRRHPPSPKKFRADTPVWLEQITLKLLSKSPKDRPSSAREVIDSVKLHSSGTHPAFRSGQRPVITDDQQKKLRQSTKGSKGSKATSDSRGKEKKSGMRPRAMDQYKSKSKKKDKGSQLAHPRAKTAGGIFTANSPLTTALLALILVVLILLLIVQVMQ